MADVVESASDTDSPPQASVRSPAPSGGHEQVSPAVARSLAALTRELPELLGSHPGRWVAYADGNRVRVADTQTELYRHCLKELGLGHHEFIVCCVVPDSGRKVEYTPR
jgi:hypothetical protein